MLKKMPSMSPPPSPRSVARKKSATLAQERDEVQKHVESETLARQTPLARRSSAYLPKTSHGDGDLRVAAGAIQTIYDIHKRYEHRRVVDNVAFAVALSGIVLVFIDNEYTSSAWSKLVVRGLNTALTVVLLGLVTWRFLLEREILIKRNVVPAHVSIVRTPRLLLSLFLELAVCTICIPPGVDGRFQVWEWKYYLGSAPLKTDCVPPFQADDNSCYMVYSHSYEVLGLLALLRLYMLPRVILNLSEFTSYRTSYLGTLHHVDTQSSLFAVKCFLRSHPFKVLIVGFTGTLLLTSYALAILEAPVNPNLVPLPNAMWLVVLTMGTIGYGDVNAVTLPGQVLLIVGGMFMGILLFGVLSSAVFGFLSLEDRDRRLLFLLRRQEHQKQLKDACARSIQAAWRHFVSVRTESPTVFQRLLSRKLRDVLYARVAAQRSVRRQSMEEFRSVASELQRCEDQLVASLKEEHAATMKRLEDVEARLDAMIAAANTAVSAAA